MKKRYIVLVILLLLAVVGYFTNPTEEQHETALKTAIRGGLSASLKANGVKNQQFFEEMTGSLFDNILWEKVMQEGIGRKNYYLFSLSKLNYLDKDYTAGIGAFGKVWIFPQVEKQTTAKFNELIKAGGGLKKSLGF